MNFSTAPLLLLLASVIAVHGAPIKHPGGLTKEIKVSKLIHETVHPIVIIPFEHTKVDDFTGPSAHMEQEIKEVMGDSPKMLERSTPLSAPPATQLKREDTPTGQPNFDERRTFGGTASAAEAGAIQSRGLLSGLFKWATHAYDFGNVGNWLRKLFQGKA